MATAIDLNSGKGKLEWESQETEAEQKARLEREQKDADHERRVRWWTFVAFLIALFVIGITGLVLIFEGRSPERERVGTMLLTSIVSGAIGFLGGRALKK
jgi:lipopolysaccharide export LptBFGC system permease protein LptF